MSGKFYNLDTRNTLGGDGASDFYVASQKAVKDYVDTAISTLPVVNTEYLKDLKDVNLGTLANGQSLVYDSTSGKWVNIAIDTSVATWGKITGSMTAQTDLTTALSAKANISHTHTKSQITDLALPSALSDLTDDLGSSPVHTHSQYLTEHQDISGKQDIITSDNKLSSDLVTDTGKTHKFVTAAQMSTWNGKQDAIADLETIRTLATSALQSGDNVSSLTNDAGYLTSEDISAVFVYKGTKATVDALPSTGNKKGDVWTVSATGAEYVWNGSAWEYLGQVLDLSGYQTKLSTTNKLNADYIQDGTTNKVVTQTEKNTWSGKQDAISDLTTIRNNATAGKGAADTIATYSDIVTHSVAEFQTAISDLETIRNNATAGKGAADTIATYGDIVTHSASEFQAKGSYSTIGHQHTKADITDFPTIGNGGVTIKKNGTAVGSFTLNQTTATNIDLTIPTTYSDVNAASASHTHTYGDVGAASAAHTHTYSDVGAASANHTHNYVPTSRKVAGKALTADITLSSSDIGDLGTTISNAISGKANSTEVYTKTEIDGKLTGAMTFKGTVTTSSALPTTGNKTGDMYNVGDTGANYAWDGTAWDKLSENVDLSGLVPNTRKINGKTLNADITLTYGDVGAASSTHTHDYVPTSRKINNKTLNADITLGYGDVGAASSSHTHTYSDVGAASANHTHSNYVPTSRKVNGKTLNADVTLTYTDVNAASDAHTHSYTDVGAASAAHSHTYSDVGAASSAHTHSYSDVGAASTAHKHTSADVTALTSYTIATQAAAIAATDSLNVALGKLQKSIDGKQASGSYVTTSRKVNGKALSADITLSASDVSALPADTEIPTVNNTNITIQRNGTAVGTIQTNQSTASAINISVPTTYSDVNAASTSHTHSGYVPTSRTINGKTLNANVTLSYSDVGALSAATSIPTVNDSGVTIKRNGTAIGSFTLNKTTATSIDITVPTTYSDVSAASAGHKHTKSDITDFPTIPTVNDGVTTIKKNGTVIGTITANQSANKSIDITVPTTYSDIDAASSSHTHSYTDVGAASSGHTHSTYVPTSRKINGKTLNADITLTYSDVSAASEGHSHTYSDVGAASSAHKHTKSDITDFPTIPTVNNVNITIKRNNTAIGTIQTNQSTASAINISVPTTYTDVSAASSGHTHSYTDVGAASASHTHSYSYLDVGAASAAHTHTYSDVGAASASHTHSGYVSTSRKVAGHALTADVTISTSDISGLSTALSGKANATETYTKSEIDGKLTGAMTFKGTVTTSSALPTQSNSKGDMYNVSDTGANYAWDGTAWDKLSENIDLSGLVPNTRKINNKTLNADITLSYSDVGAASSSHTHTYSDVGAASASHTHSYVPTSRKVNGKTLNADITLSYSDVGALSASTSIPTVNNSGVTIKKNGTAIGSFTLNQTSAANIDIAVPTTYSDVSAASAGHTHSDYVPTSRKINGKTLNSDVTLTYSDVSALSAGTTIPTVNNVNITIKRNGTAISTIKTNQSTASSVDISVPTTYSDVSAASAAHTHTKSDITDFPTIPAAANDGKTTIKRNGTAIGTISANQSSNLSIDISVPTTYSDVSAASAGHTHSGYVPTSRTINSKSLTADITLTYSDVSAASAGHTHSYTYSDVGAASAGHTHSGYVPTSRKINGKTLNADVTLSYSDVGALSASTSIPTVNNSNMVIQKNGTAVGTFTANQSAASTINISVPTTYSDVSAASSGHTHSGYVPTTRKINSKTLNADITLTYSDVGALSASTSIPTVNNTGITIKRNGTAIGSFTLNQTTAGNIDISVPTTYSDVSAASSNHTHSGYVPTTRKINGKTLNADVTLTYSDVGALSSATTIPTVNNANMVIQRNGTAVGTFTANQSAASTINISVPTTYTDVSAASSGHTHSGYAASTHYHASNGVTVMTGYTKASAAAAIAATDSLNTAIGKLEYKIDNAGSSGASKVDGISGATINRFCTCSTAASTAAKTASVTAGTPTLEAGLKVTVKFSNKNTASTPTFNLNSLGAKNIYVDGAQITTGSNKGILNGVLDLVYDGTQWHIVGSTMATVGMIA